MQTIILAAGLGNRLGDLTADLPKAMVKVNGKELIRYVMDYLDHPKVTEKIVVTGCGREKLEPLIREHYPEVKLIHNPKFRDGNILTLGEAMPHIEDDFLLMNVDHIYPKQMLDHILKDRDGITAICDFDRTLGADDMKVKIGDDGTLMRIDKQLKDYDCGYIGMTHCCRDSLNMYREAFDVTLRERGNRACVENILAWLGDRSASINICDASGMPWLEVDTREDLEHAERTLRENADFLL